MRGETRINDQGWLEEMRWKGISFIVGNIGDEPAVAGEAVAAHIAVVAVHIVVVVFVVLALPVDGKFVVVAGELEERVWEF